MEKEKNECLKRLEKFHHNLDSGLTQEKYLEICKQMGNEPVAEEMPPDWNDFPEIVKFAINTFNMLGDRVYPDIGYIGKDYTNLPHYIEVYDIEDKEYFLQILSWLDSRAIKKSSEQLKREYDKMKRQSSGKRNQTNIKG